MPRELAIDADRVIGSVVWRTVLAPCRAHLVGTRHQRAVDSGRGAVEVGLALELDRAFDLGDDGF